MEIANLLKAELTLDAEKFDAGLEEAERKAGAFERTASSSFKKTGLSARGMAGDVRGAASRMVAENDNVAQSARRAALGMDGMAGAARKLAASLGAIAGALAASALTRYADAWSDMQSRVGAAIKDMEAAPALMERIVDIANASYSPLEQTVQVYSRNVAVLRDLGRSATEAADFTEALNHALVITATRGERAASVQNALSKAMAVGKLQADGLETVLANGGEVAQALADELVTNVNGLRHMATQGKITGDVIANALITRLDDLRDRAGEMPATIGDAFVRIQTNLTAFIGQMDKAAGVSETVATALMKFADNIDRVITYGAAAVTMFGTYYVAAMIAAKASTVTLTGALTLLRTALVRLGIGALVVGAGELVYQFSNLVRATGGFGGAMEALGSLASGVWEGIIVSAKAIPPGLGAIWETVRAGFFRLLENLTQRWAAFLAGLAETAHSAGLSETFELLNTAANRASASVHGFSNSAKQAEERAAGLRAESAELAFKGFEKVRSAAAELAAIVSSGGEATDSAGAAADRLKAVLGRVEASADGAAGGISRAGKAASEAEREFEQFLRTADQFGEKLFPGHAAAAEAAELLHLLDKYRGALTDIQQTAVDARIDELFEASRLGVRDLGNETGKAAKEMEKALKPVGDDIGDFFDGVVESIDEFGEI